MTSPSDLRGGRRPQATSDPQRPATSRLGVNDGHAPQRGDTESPTACDHASTDTPALFDDLGALVNVPQHVDTATIVSAQFHRVVRLASGQLVAEFLPRDLALPRIVLDEAELYAAAIFAPTLNEELEAAIQAMDRMRRKLDRLQSVNSTTKPKGDRTDANYRS